MMTRKLAKSLSMILLAPVVLALAAVVAWVVVAATDAST